MPQKSLIEETSGSKPNKTATQLNTRVNNPRYKKCFETVMHLVRMLRKSLLSPRFLRFFSCFYAYTADQWGDGKTLFVGKCQVIQYLRKSQYFYNNLFSF